LKKWLPIYLGLTDQRESAFTSVIVKIIYPLLKGENYSAAMNSRPFSSDFYRSNELGTFMSWQKRELAALQGFQCGSSLLACPKADGFGKASGAGGNALFRSLLMPPPREGFGKVACRAFMEVRTIETCRGRD
jgi:hypothetical protein